MKNNESFEVRDLRLEDESGDRKYFTIIPNFILNHSTAIDQALYLQMKRYAGEKGSCYASGRTLRKKLGIGQKAYEKAISYLLEHNWIYHKGEQTVDTLGGPQIVKVYGVRDLWKMNNEHYDKGVAESDPLTPKGVARSSEGVAESFKGVSKSITKKNNSIRTIQEEPTKNPAPSAGVLGNEVINLFKDINPSYQQLFKRKPQHQAAERLVSIHGFERLGNVVRFISNHRADQYCPTVTSPMQLEEKWSALEKYAIGLKNIKKTKIAFV